MVFFNKSSEIILLEIINFAPQYCLFELDKVFLVFNNKALNFKYFNN